jgi:hypothetical protein
MRARDFTPWITVAWYLVSCGGEASSPTGKSPHPQEQGSVSGSATGSSSGSGSASDAGSESTVTATCPASSDFNNDGTTGNLSFGPGNQVFTGMTRAPEVVDNYEMLEVYSPPNLAAYFEGETLSLGPPVDPTVAPWLPASDGDASSEFAPSAAYAWIGELALIPGACAGQDVTGRTITVHFFVPLLGAVPGIPVNGAALGSYHGRVQTAYSDAIASGVISTLGELVFSHTFSAQEAQDVTSNGVFLRVYAYGYSSCGAVDSGLCTAVAEEVRARLYVNKIIWS